MADFIHLPIQSCVYVIGPIRGLQKVGMALNPHRRRGSLQSQTGKRLHIHAVVTVDFSIVRAVEQYAHWILRENRKYGEWFSVSPEAAAAAITEAKAAVIRGDRQKHHFTGPGHVGRRRVNGENEALVLARFFAGTVDRIDALRLPAESRAGFVREAVEREIMRRERQKGKDAK